MSIIHYGYHGDVHQLSQVWDPILYVQFQWITELSTEGDGGAPGRVGDRQGSPGTPFGVVQPPQKGRNSAEKTYHDLEDENGISLIFINIS